MDTPRRHATRASTARALKTCRGADEALAAAPVAREATGVGTRIDGEAAAAVIAGEGEVAVEAIALLGDGGAGAAVVSDPGI